MTQEQTGRLSKKDKLWVGSTVALMALTAIAASTILPDAAHAGWMGMVTAAVYMLALVVVPIAATLVCGLMLTSDLDHEDNSER